ncbi:MAG: hypothetical protein K0R93_1061 [Anaerosolibacter sp.]|jgi:hypothetical protein|uniref:hypothetical protein n=1 Tax=Anaerosolibacter sp. TaxID=1872527 RepID=UPI0026061263|nr:hypothetical protein [Anaerosolibacter sp.]MDF2546163.1 hypothetical protein [Anaerosolibacter sp.]
MSYELDYEKKVSCPCEKGQIVETSSSNDWNQVKSNIYIECMDCKNKYHIEYQYAIHGDHDVSIPYLVPNGETLIRNNSYNINEVPFSKQLCLSYSLDILDMVYQVLCKSTTYSKITDETTRSIVRRSKRSVNGTMRINTVRECVSEAIQNYNNLNVNYDKDTERIADVKKRSLRIMNL